MVGSQVVMYNIVGIGRWDKEWHQHAKGIPLDHLLGFFDGNATGHGTVQVFGHLFDPLSFPLSNLSPDAVTQWFLMWRET